MKLFNLWMWAMAIIGAIAMQLMVVPEGAPAWLGLFLDVARALTLTAIVVLVVVAIITRRSK